MSKYFDDVRGEDFTPDGIKIDELAEAVCPECHAELIFMEEVGHELNDGVDGYEVDGYKYYCPECGREFTLKEEL